MNIQKLKKLRKELAGMPIKVENGAKATSGSDDTGGSVEGGEGEGGGGGDDDAESNRRSCGRGRGYLVSTATGHGCSDVSKKSKDRMCDPV